MTLPVADPGAAPEEVQRELLQRLLLAAELHDPPSLHHARRVGELTGRLASALGHGPEDVERLTLTAALHDVGKVAIADEVLQRTGPFSAGDREEMARHPLLGHELLRGSGMPWLDEAAEIALTHHERMDGTGYPRGLSGDAIPRSGRLVAVADVFDALTSARPYRAPLPVDEALFTMAAETGHFDPEVLGALERVAEGGGAQAWAPPPELGYDERLRSAVAPGQFDALLSPVTDLRSREVVLHHLVLAPRAGEPGTPSGLLAHADRLGRRVRVSHATLRYAAGAVAAGLAKHVLVSLTPACMANPTVLELLAEAGPAAVVGLDAQAAAPEVTAAGVAVARERGCRVALGGFGGAAHDLRTLATCPVDYVLPDPGLWDRFVSDPRRQLVLRGLAGMAYGLGSRLVLLDLDGRHALDTAQGLGVDAAGGSALGRPTDRLVDHDGIVRSNRVPRVGAVR